MVIVFQLNYFHIILEIFCGTDIIIEKKPKVKDCKLVSTSLGMLRTFLLFVCLLDKDRKAMQRNTTRKSHSQAVLPGQCKLH